MLTQPFPYFITVASDLHITATVGPLSLDATTGLLRSLLAANLMIRENGGAALALDLNRDEIVLHRQLPLEGLSYAVFERNLEAFLNHLERCRGLLDEAGSAGGQTTLIGDSGGFNRIRV